MRHELVPQATIKSERKTEVCAWAFKADLHVSPSYAEMAKVNAFESKVTNPDLLLLHISPSLPNALFSHTQTLCNLLIALKTCRFSHFVIQKKLWLKKTLSDVQICFKAHTWHHACCPLQAFNRIFSHRRHCVSKC